MVTYEVYHGEHLIGHLQVKDGLHKYIPVAETVQALQHEVFLLRQVIDVYPWGKPIPFFEQLISNNRKVGRETLLYSHTHHYSLRRISGPSV